MDYTDEQWRKIAGPKSEFITPEKARELVSGPIPRPRVYGLWSGQIVSVHSTHDLDRITCERYWRSHTTLADILPRKA